VQRDGESDGPRSEARQTKAKTYRLETVTRSIAKGDSNKRKLALRLSSTVTRTIRRALKAHKRIVVTFEITVADTAGNKKVYSRSVRLMR
jgi:hypothetical protein